MNFQVPQFIEVEDKIFGPLTFKQFAYLGGGVGLGFIIWVYMPLKFLAVLLIIPVVALALALAFYKVHNRPFLLVLESAFKYFLSRKLYIWKKTAPATKSKTATEDVPNQSVTTSIPRLSKSRLKDLSWSLDVQEKIK